MSNKHEQMHEFPSPRGGELIHELSFEQSASILFPSPRGGELIPGFVLIVGVVLLVSVPSRG